MSGLLATVEPRRIKASHRRRRRIASGQSVQRYYDPSIGRFLSVDPVTANPNTGANFNRYKYASNNPYKFIDPDGRADSTWFTPNDKNGLFESGTGFDVPKFHSFSAHATDKFILGPQGQQFGGSAAVKFAQANDGLKSGQPLFVAACNVGANGGQLALDMANANQSLVVAARGYVNFPSSKDLNGDGKGMYQSGNPVTLTVSAKDGSPSDFALFRPGGTGAVPGVSVRSITIDPQTSSITGMTVRTAPETGSRIWRTEKIDLTKK